MLNTSMASSSSSSSRSFKYDVFLSFRGEDTRKNFVDHLYTALDQQHIRTYKDDITLPRGESVGLALKKAIEESHIAVVIFSKNYADSSWCLDELVHIMTCMDDQKGQIVMPVFYDVDPSEVRNQKGDFGKAFAKQKRKNVNKSISWRKVFAKQESHDATKAESWRTALVAASNIAGWEPKNVANGHEAAVVQNIVDAISSKIYPICRHDSDIDEELVGMTDRINDLISTLEIGTGGVRMVGIWGVGGGGKTTLATSVYMKINDRFQGHCVVDNIREESSKSGLKKLQEIFLKEVSKKEVTVQSVEQGKRMIQSRLRHSNVLILLDDVDDPKQVEALAGSHSWFGYGSRIIITTRNEHLLRKVDYVFPVRLLSQDEGNQLFKKHAYNEKRPLKDYWELSLRVVSYAAGLPLALKVLGSFLYDKDSKEWMSTLDRLKDIPESEIVEKLKISYDGLKKVEKELFLDIACFFRLSRINLSMDIFKACGFHPDIGIKVLIQKALITFDSDGVFDMHDLVQEMAHYIVRGEHPDNPEKHSRVWKREDINKLCIENATTENDKIEAIGEYYPSPDLVPSQFFKFVSNLKKLRWIHVAMSNDSNVEGPNFLSNELRYFYWANYPASPFPDSFQPMNLVTLQMWSSFQKELWRSDKCLPQLKVLSLHRMRIVSTPNFDGLPCLQRLELGCCDDLEEIHPSIGNHRSLKNVNVYYCPNLRMFPTISKMEKLECLQISNCHKSLEFPDIQGNMESLVELSLDGIGIKGLLSSIGERCTSLISLHLYNCFFMKSIEIDFDGLKHLKDLQIRGNTLPGKMPLDLFTEKVLPQLTHRLQRLDLVDCCLEDGEIPSAIGEMSNLQELRLNNNNFSKLHFSISQLKQLKLLNLSGCKRLLELPQLPSSIAILLANECDSLTDVGDFYADCKRLRYGSLMCSNMVIDGNRFLQSMLEGVTAENHCVVLQLQGLEIPKGFTPCLLKESKWRSECTLELPEKWCSDFCGFLMCVVVKNDITNMSNLEITMEQVITGDSLGMDSEDDVVWEESVAVGDEITWVGYFPFASLRHTNWWDSTYKKLSFSFHIGSFSPKPSDDSNNQFIIPTFSGFGVRLVHRKGGNGPTETSAAEILRELRDSKYSLIIKPRSYY